MCGRGPGKKKMSRAPQWVNLALPQGFKDTFTLFFKHSLLIMCQVLLVSSFNMDLIKRKKKTLQYPFYFENP